MTEYEAVLNSECKKALNTPIHKGFTREMSLRIKEMMPDINFSRKMVGTHVHICMGVVKHGGVFSLNHKSDVARKKELEQRDQELVNYLRSIKGVR